MNHFDARDGSDDSVIEIDASGFGSEYFDHRGVGEDKRLALETRLDLAWMDTLPSDHRNRTS